MKIKNIMYVFLLIATVHSAYGMWDDPRGILHRAISDGNLELVQSMVKADSNIVHEHDPLGFGPLHLAVQYGRLPIVKCLIASGVNIDSQDSCYGQTALHHAVKSGHLEIVTWLLAHGADIDAQDKSWNKVEHMHSIKDGSEIKLCLNEYRQLAEQAEINPTKEVLEKAIRGGYLNLVSTILKKFKVCPSQENITLAKMLFESTSNALYQGIGKVLIDYKSLWEQIPVSQGQQRTLPTEVLDHIINFVIIINLNEEDY